MELLPSDDDTSFYSFSHDACRRLAGTIRILSFACTKGELGGLIAEELLKYSVFDLQVICGKIHHEIGKLPSPYREAVRPYFLQQIYESHHNILLMHRSGELECMDVPLKDPSLFREYLAMVPSNCCSRDFKSEYVPHLYSPVQTLFYYLIAAFYMFVLDRPGHPVGMPFPGGFRVESRGGQFFCPVRDKEKEVHGSICNFCPALQSLLP
jgi:uncharacterized protein (UPF0305 family)